MLSAATVQLIWFMAQLEPGRDWAAWQQHADGSGRAYLANPYTKETMWLWGKWALNGRVFCVNVVTNDRVWQEDMSPELRIAAGLPPPPPPPPVSLPQSLPRPSAGAHHVPSVQAMGRGKRQSEVGGGREEGAYGASISKRARVSDGAGIQDRVQCAPRGLDFRSQEAQFSHKSISDHYANIAFDRPRGTHDAGLRPDETIRETDSHDRPGSRFATAVPSHTLKRSCPSSPSPQAIPPRRRNSSFRPTGKQAQAILAILRASSTPAGSWRVALLYEREFAANVSSWPPEEQKVLHGSSDGIRFGAVVGTCSVEEKMFLRLTSAPDPQDVRPLHVLKRALKGIKRSWAKQLRDYEWVCSQLKSIRQDLHIQHIETTEALDVYETHARIALENSDLGEFNTCLAQLTELYSRVDRLKSVRDEFAAYRIIYNVVVGENDTEFARMLCSMSIDERERPPVKYAIQVRRAVLDGNYDSFFRLYESPPPRTMVTFLLKHLVGYMRSRALAVVSVAYSPGKVPLSFLLIQLFWDEGLDAEEVNAKENVRNDDIVVLNTVDLRSPMASSISVNVPRVLQFCEEIGLVVERSGKDEIVPFVVNTKASRARGVSILQNRRGLITAAGSQKV